MKASLKIQRGRCKFRVVLISITSLNKKKEYDASLGTIKGYKIQIFYGTEDDAHDIKDEFKELFPDIETKIIFNSPDWKVQMGNFKTRLEADNALVDIKSDFPNAIIFATDIEY